jgi:hypothetical protein
MAVLQWLLEHSCPHNNTLCCWFAAAYGHIAVLVYLQSLGWLTSAVVLRTTLRIAGAFDQLAAAQWVRQQGAEWPSVLRYREKPWLAEVVAWARAEGCTAPTE